LFNSRGVVHANKKDWDAAIAHYNRAFDHGDADTLDAVAGALRARASKLHSGRPGPAARQPPSAGSTSY
jgi:hypothetical protein